MDYREYQDVKSDELIKFWTDLFPEIASEDEIFEIINKISDYKKEELINKYKENETKKDLFIVAILKKPINDKLSKLLREIRTNLRWVYFFQPILNYFFEKFEAIVEQSSIIYEKDEFYLNIIKRMLNNMVNISFRVIVQEVQLTKSEGKLVGETPEERSRYFCDVLFQDRDYLYDVYNAYSELVNILHNTVKNTVNYIEEILVNTEHEKQVLEERLCEGRAVGKLREIEIAQGDTHNNGKSVAKLIFENTILIYKPRSLSMERKYGEFIEWLSEVNSKFVPCFCAKTYSKGDMGWMEFVKNEECDNISEINKYYYIMGELLCIIYTFQGKDFHHENVIASKSSPVLIDLETLLHLNIGCEEDGIFTYINQEIQSSVIGSAMLPTLFENNNTCETMEVGAMGKCIEQVSPFKTQVLKDVDSDEIHIEFEYKKVPHALNYPMYKGKGVGCEEYLKEVRDGFTQIYKWISNNKHLYLEKIYELFQYEKCRVICKNTNLYTQLLETSHHPDILYNEIDREVYYHRIGLVINNNIEFKEKQLYRAEIDMLMNDDVPMFYTYADDTRVMYGEDKYVGVDCKRSAIDCIIDTINKMSDLDLNRQIALINESFIGSQMKTDVPFKTNMSYKDLSLGDDAEKIDLVREIENLCIQRGITFENQIGWIGMYEFGESNYKIIPTGCNLYQGNTGIMIFLLEASQVTNNQIAREKAKQAFNAIMYNLKKEIELDSVYDYGAFTGLGSELYAIYYVLKKDFYKLTEEDVEVFEQGIELLERHIGDINGFDVLYGTSGLLGVMLSIVSIEHETISESVKSKCIRVAKKLFVELEHSANYIDKNIVTWGEKEDIGYAHGNAGVITQLVRYYIITKDQEAIELIRKALTYERNKKYDKDTKKWCFRENVHYHSWCNGIGGLILSKIMLLKLWSNDDILHHEIKDAVEQLKECGFGVDSGLCHGDLGSICILEYVSYIFDDKELYRTCKRMKNYFAENYVKKNWSRYNDTEEWGLMTGISGIGLGILPNNNNVMDIFYLK